MHLLYCDESGAPGNSGDKYFVLAGISLFERQTYWLSNKLDDVAKKFDPEEPSLVELHGNPMHGRKKFWRNFTKAETRGAIKDALNIFNTSQRENRCFACVVHKNEQDHREVVELAFEQLSSRFDQYLGRIYKRGNKEAGKDNAQRGVIIFDKSTYEETIQNLATDFRDYGHQWGSLKNLAEVPLFLDSKASRLIQLADLVAYAIYRYYEHGDPQYFQLIENRFDFSNGKMHGLVER